MRFIQRWQVRAPRPTVVDLSTGNRIPGPAPAAVPVWGVLQERFPENMQTEMGTGVRSHPARGVVVDQPLLCLEPAAAALGITTAHQVIGPDGAVWSVVRIPVHRHRHRFWSRPVRYVALYVRRSTDIIEQ